MALFARLWTDILADPKLLRAARNGAKDLEILPWLIVFCKLSDDSGRISVNGEPAEPQDISNLIPCVTPRRVTRCIEELERIGVIVTDPDGCKRLASWEHRSGKPSDGKEATAERVRKHREKKRALQLTLGNTPVTPRRNATEQEQELEIEQELEKKKKGVTAVTVGAQQTAPPPPPDLAPVHLGKTAGERTLASKLPSDLDRLALTAICAIVPAPASWVAEASAALDGMHGKITTPAQLGIALREFVGSGHHLEHPPSFKLFRRFIENATNGAGTAGNGTGNASDAAGKGPTARTGSGEAGSILARIKGFAEKVTPQAGGAVQVLRRDRVAELGADVLAAFDAVGGAEAVLKTPGEKWGFFIRDFSNALAYARQNGVADG